tara:strand:+ start:484 stop:963 length:480 start_codon:yes stop_codon:yes gene_type:complete
MEDKNPVSNLKSEAAKRSGISDKEHHAISSNTDANSVMLDGSKYDKDYDKLTDAVGYVDPDSTITTSTITGLASKSPKRRGSTISDRDDSLINMGSPAHQGGYRGGGDVNSYYVPMAGVYQNLQDSISKNMAEVYKFQDYKGDAKENLLTHEEAKKMYG